MPKLVRIVIQLPQELKIKLDSLKQQGYTASGYIRAMLEREFSKFDDEETAAVAHQVVPHIRRS